MLGDWAPTTLSEFWALLQAIWAHEYTLPVFLSMAAAYLVMAISIIRRGLWRLLRWTALLCWKLVKLPFSRSNRNEISETTDHAIFPSSESMEWHPKFLEAVEILTRQNRLVLHGSVGTGRLDFAISALKSVGFPAHASQDDCSWALFEGQADTTASDVLGNILEANLFSISSDMSTKQLFEQIVMISQRRYCSIVITNFALINERDRKVLVDLTHRVASKFRFVLVSSDIDAALVKMPSKELGALGKNDLKNWISAGNYPLLTGLHDPHLVSIVEATKGNFSTIRLLFCNSQSESELVSKLDDLASDEALLLSSIRSTFDSLTQAQSRALAFVARYGGTASWDFLVEVFEISEIEKRAIAKIFATSPFTFLHGMDTSGYVEFRSEACVLIERELRTKYRFTSSGTIDRICRFFEKFDEIEGQNVQYSSFRADRGFVGSLIIECGENELLDEALRLFRASCELMFNRGYFEQRIDLGYKLGRMLEAKDRLAEASWVLCASASVATVVGRQTGTARLGIERALILARSADSQNDVFRAERALAGTFYRQGLDTLFEAETHLNRVINVPDAQQDLNNYVDAAYLDICLKFRGPGGDQSLVERKEVLAAIKLMLDAGERAGWDRGIGYARLEEARLAALDGKIDRARALALEARTIGEEYVDRRHIARCWMLLGQISLASNRRGFGSGFNNGLKLLRDAESEFLKLKMDNERAEATAIYDDAIEVWPMRKLPYKLWHTDRPIGGD